MITLFKGLCNNTALEGWVWCPLRADCPCTGQSWGCPERRALSLQCYQLSHFPVVWRRRWALSSPLHCSAMARPGFPLGVLLDSLKLVTSFLAGDTAAAPGVAPVLPSAWAPLPAWALLPAWAPRPAAVSAGENVSPGLCPTDTTLGSPGASARPRGWLSADLPPFPEKHPNVDTGLVGNLPYFSVFLYPQQYWKSQELEWTGTRETLGHFSSVLLWGRYKMTSLRLSFCMCQIGTITVISPPLFQQE